MTDFKVGDKVEVIRGTHKGHVGTITEHRGDKAIWPWHVKYPADSYGSASFGIFEDSELKLVKPEPKFQVGDLVTFAEPGNDRWQGGKAEVIEGKGLGRYSTRVRIIEGPPLNDMYRDNKGYEFNADPEHLEPWVAPEVPNSEAVDGPAHYGGKDNPYEVIKVAEAWGFEKNAYLFNALKYLGRAGKKGSKVEDLKKLVFYVQREIALEEAK